MAVATVKSVLGITLRNGIRHGAGRRRVGLRRRRHDEAVSSSCNTDNDTSTRAFHGHGICNPCSQHHLQSTRTRPYSRSYSSRRCFSGSKTRTAAATIDEHSFGGHLHHHEDFGHTKNSTKINNDESSTLNALEEQLDKFLEGAMGVGPSAPSSSSTTTSPLQYQNVWDLPTTPRHTNSYNTYLVPLDSDKRLDRHSRFVLELLQTLKEVGLTNTIDRVTTERCNAILNQLATIQQTTATKASPRSEANASADDANENDHDDNTSEEAHGDDTSSTQRTTHNRDLDSIVDHWQRIERANAILEAMESYKPLREHRSSIPTDLPTPSHDTYFAVLKLYSGAKQISAFDLENLKRSSEAAEAGADNANDTDIFVDIGLLEASEDAPLKAKAIVERMEDSGELSLVPTSLHWNQVLSCYANASLRPNRPLEAATLLYRLLQPPRPQSKKSGSGVFDIGSGISNNRVDVSSFSHVLRACADADALEDYFDDCQAHRSSPPQQQQQQREHHDHQQFWKEKETFAKLALGVAERVWKGLQQQQRQMASVPRPRHDDHLSNLLDNDENFKSSDPPSRSDGEPKIPMNSHHFVHMLKAGRNFATQFVVERLKNRNRKPPESKARGEELSKLKEKHEDWVRRIFQEACNHQKVNIHVLQEVMYQGAVLRSVFDDDTGERSANSTTSDSFLDWVQRIVVAPQSPGSSPSSSTMEDRFRNRWDKEIVPSLLDSRSKQRQRHHSSSSHSPLTNSRRQLETVYASTIHQTRILLRCLPSRWGANAD